MGWINSDQLRTSEPAWVPLMMTVCAGKLTPAQLQKAELATRLKEKCKKCQVKMQEVLTCPFLAFK